MDSEALPVEFIRRQERMENDRRNFDIYWHNVATYVIPRLDDFTTQRAPGQRRDQYVFDSTSCYALDSFAAAIESLLTPRTQKWHTYVPEDERLKDDRDCKVWCEALRDRQFRARYKSKANFAGQTGEAYRSLGAFGNGCMFVDDKIGEGIRYQNIPLQEAYIQEDEAGRVDTVHRKFKKTVRQALKMWGDRLPEQIKKWETKEPDREFDFLHCVQPNGEIKLGMRNWQGMSFSSFYVAFEGKALIGTGGYRKMPYAFSRYTTTNREKYGRSVAMQALADTRTLNEMVKTSLRYGQLVTDPPWLTADVDSLSAFSVRPGSINPGYLNERGEPLAKSLVPEGDPKFSLEIQQQKRESINRAFLVTLFQILVDNGSDRMTATEVMERAQEKGALLAPTMGQQQGDLLDPIAERELDILEKSGALRDMPPMPPALRRSGGGIKVEYTSPLAAAQKASEGVGILRTLEALAVPMQADPSVAKRINWDRTVQRLADINGAPADILNSDEEMAALNAQAAQQAQLANLAQIAPALSTSIKNVAQANQAAQTPQF